MSTLPYRSAVPASTLYEQEVCSGVVVRCGMLLRYLTMLESGPPRGEERDDLSSCP